MFNWKFLLMMLLPLLNAVGTQMINKDANNTGADDIEGQAMLFGVQLLTNIANNNTAALEKMLPAEAKTVSVTSGHFNSPAAPTGGG